MQYEAWGRADMQAFRRMTAPTAAVVGRGSDMTHLESLWLYRLELQNMLVMEMAHRRRRLCGVTLLVDAGNITTEHGGLREFLREVSLVVAPPPLVWGLKRVFAFARSGARCGASCTHTACGT